MTVNAVVHAEMDATVCLHTSERPKTLSQTITKKLPKATDEEKKAYNEIEQIDPEYYDVKWSEMSKNLDKYLAKPKDTMTTAGRDESVPDEMSDATVHVLNLEEENMDDIIDIKSTHTNDVSSALENAMQNQLEKKSSTSKEQSAITSTKPKRKNKFDDLFKTNN